MPFGRKIDKIAITTFIARTSKMYPNRDFLFDIYHLATLMWLAMSRFSETVSAEMASE
jgi:hypothetical protein